ncbi:toxin-antitoxin system YwqK family antitoxin [Fusobacterium nucleatum]|uniref:toxin-antitoxin system YwqK family antitoxin n=1 Tax=Fusobacterium nucleatum TaxID=851 RepID=UPI0030D615F7
MKKLLLGLFLISSALTFSARVVKSTETVLKDNLIYVGEETTPYTGVIETYNEQGILLEKTEFKNGLRDGSSKKYFINGGKVSLEAIFSNGIQVGVQKRYYESGELLSELSYKNGKMDGIGKSYYQNGQVEMEEPYKNGERDGVIKVYDENGKLVRQATFKNGKQIK